MIILQNSLQWKKEGFRMVIAQKPNAKSKYHCGGGLAASLESPDESQYRMARGYISMKAKF